MGQTAGLRAGSKDREQDKRVSARASGKSSYRPLGQPAASRRMSAENILERHLNKSRSERKGSLGPRVTVSRRYEAVTASEANSSAASAGVEMTELNRVDWKLSQPSSTAKRRRDSITSWLHSSHCVSVRRSVRRGEVRGLRKDGKRTHDWTKRDVSGVMALSLFVLGAVFIICMISWANNESVPLVVQASLTSFCQDVFVRIAAIVITEYLLIAPLCLCICFCRYMGDSERQNDSISRARQRENGFYVPLVLKSDEKAFTFDATAHVARVYPYGRRLGIQVGWRVVAVDGNSVRDGKECGRRIRRLHRMCDTFDVLFTDDAKRRQKMVAENDQRNALMASLRAGEIRAREQSISRTPRISTYRRGSNVSLRVSSGVADPSSDSTTSEDGALVEKADSDSTVTDDGPARIIV